MDLSLYQTNDILKRHGDQLSNGQFFLKKSLKAFKKVYHTKDAFPAIANLIIPVGAIVNPATSNDCKLRANEVYCWSIKDLGSEMDLDQAYSGNDTTFSYQSNERKFKNLYGNIDLTEKLEGILIDLDSFYRRSRHLFIKPRSRDFDFTTSECEPGIHFFLELSRAKRW